MRLVQVIGLVPVCPGQGSQKWVDRLRESRKFVGLTLITGVKSAQKLN